MKPSRFLAMVGALVWRWNDGKYLVLQRSESKDFAAGQWECVSGRVDQGESFLQAVRRETREELGLDVRIEFILGTAHFYRGDTLPRNEMVGVHFGCSIDGAAELRLSDEHSTYKWVTAAEAITLFQPEYWLGALIARAQAFRDLMPDELRRLHWNGDFDF